jgi:hypothetical protein
MQSIRPNTRRHFLLAAGLGGAAAIAAVATSRVTPGVVAPAAAVARQPSGYRATAHILQYYRTAQV